MATTSGVPHHYLLQPHQPLCQSVLIPSFIPLLSEHLPWIEDQAGS